MTAEQLDDLITEQVTEDQFLEYKDGRELDNRDKAAKTLRQYMSGFANGDGGVLIIGVNDKEWKVTGCPAPGGGDLSAWGGDLAEWASDCVVPIASLFSQRPEFFVVDHSNGKVLAAWTARSVNMVHCNEGGEWVHYLRFHDKTLRAPDYLIADLMLGRRQHPYLAITSCDLGKPRWESTFARLRTDEICTSFHITFSVENQSLAWTEGLRVGIIGWDREKTSPLSSHLLSQIVVMEPRGTGAFVKQRPFHHVGTNSMAASIPPFTVETVPIGGICSLTIRINEDWYTPYKWKAAVYLLSVNSPPVWYQLTLMVGQKLRQLAENQGTLTCESEIVEIQRVSGERPHVACILGPF